MISAHINEKIAKLVLWISSLTILAILLAIIGFVVMRSIGIINLEFIFSMPRAGGREGGILSMIIGTLCLIAISTTVASPIGIGGGIYLTEYAGEHPLSKIITFGAEWLAGVPSIIFGLFGFAFFVVFLGWGFSILSGGMVLACMILNETIRTTQESIKAVPASYREASYALGATKWQTVSRVVLKSAAPGILTGIILGIGRAAGETAAIMLTVGSFMALPTSLFSSVRPMSLHLYLLAIAEVHPGAIARAFGTATLLVLMVLIVNLSVHTIMRRYTRALR
ncbi:phosphate ABC transporter permease PstA [candidate division NPL-UPA2 bacterium Unc8]|uniref:Phosphate transport system permease protein PstA n=1 Tax=candidate division NPL-UPA2 bacterium Unc8 TaxID=1980939 RepID=A0A399FX32_UNCN2|nr:Phosphate transport system permease protein PstA 1 [Bacillota bacterium]MBT9148029.1 Phosphate transport system permease protein PstA 1 [Bacillota bacterium]RIH99702.1 MAG: phosphate ABC transporter permease PstA [candidate division NPL-UPA2 bacterium Unc8]